jgi:predicted N-acetyltransferase YhbS
MEPAHAPSIVLRTAVAGDAAFLTATISAAFEQYRGQLIPESGAFRETADAISRELAAGSGAIIAEQDGEALGCVMIKPVDGDLYFGRLAVTPWARGRGIARRLVKAVEDEAYRRGLAGVRLGVRIVLTENRRLFTSLGYVETSREAHPGFDHPTSISMRKELSPDRVG